MVSFMTMDWVVSGLFVSCLCVSVMSYQDSSRIQVTQLDYSEYNLWMSCGYLRRVPTTFFGIAKYIDKS